MGETKIIGFGHRMYSGKDTAIAAIIQAYPWLDVRRYAFADALKLEVYDALLNDSDPFWEFYASFDTDILFPLETPMIATADIPSRLAFINERKDALRHILQVWGTEWRRAQDPLYWVYQLSKRIHAEAPAYALIADMRFLNEFYWVKGAGGTTVNVQRTDGFQADATHPSEHELDSAPYDLVIEAASVQELQANAVDLFKIITSSAFPEIMQTV